MPVSALRTRILCVALVLPTYIFPLVLHAQSATTPAGVAVSKSNELPFFEDYRFWVALIGLITGTISLVLSLLGHWRAERGEQRLNQAELRAQQSDSAYRRAAEYLLYCESAAGQARPIDDRHHPEWEGKASLQGPSIGEFQSDDGYVSILYVEVNYQINPIQPYDKTIATTWYKWYIGLSKPDMPTDVFAIFGFLQQLLKRPGKVEFEVGDRVPDWVREKLSGRKIFGILFGETTIY